MARFRVSRAAQADIREIGRNTQQQWGKDQRRIYLDGLNDRFQLLANTPLLAAERLTFDPPVRIHPYQRHLIVYVIEDGGILIVRVLLDLSRFCSGLFRAILSMKETRNSTKIQRRIQARCGSHYYDKRADVTANCVRFGRWRFDPEQVSSKASTR